MTPPFASKPGVAQGSASHSAVQKHTEKRRKL